MFKLNYFISSQSIDVIPLSSGEVEYPLMLNFNTTSSNNLCSKYPVSPHMGYGPPVKIGAENSRMVQLLLSSRAVIGTVNHSPTSSIFGVTLKFSMSPTKPITGVTATPVKLLTCYDMTWHDMHGRHGGTARASRGEHT